MSYSTSQLVVLSPKKVIIFNNSRPLKTKPLTILTWLVWSKIHPMQMFKFESFWKNIAFQNRTLKLWIQARNGSFRQSQQLQLCRESLELWTTSKRLTPHWKNFYWDRICTTNKLKKSLLFQNLWKNNWKAHSMIPSTKPFTKVWNNRELLWFKDPQVLVKPKLFLVLSASF